ncbi:MAG: hypothetical protein ABW047_05840 [Nitrospiraceae bacterium]
MCGQFLKSDREWMVCAVLVSLWTVVFGVLAAHPAETKTGKAFRAVVTDSQGVETDLNNVVFYWEEKVSDTSFVPHEVRHLPVQRGTSNVNIKFETIAQLDVKQGAEKGGMTMVVTLTNGKKGDFVPSVNGTLRGESDFGQVDVPMSAISKVVFK